MSIEPRSDARSVTLPPGESIGRVYRCSTGAQPPTSECRIEGAAESLAHEEDSTMTGTIPAWAAPSAKAPLAPHPITRPEPGPRDAQNEILYCGVCHSDVHQVRNEWADSMPSVFPMVPGHEIVGRVTKVGADVSKFAVGDVAGVG